MKGVQKMIYSPKKIQTLITSVEEHMTEKEQKAVKEILSNYNKLFIVAKEKADELNRKREQFARESNENEKLRQRNKELERDKDMLKRQNREQRELLKMYRKK